MANKISVVLDLAADKAVSGFKGVKNAINDADGAVGKFKAGASSAFDSIKGQAGNVAMVAGAAIVTFGVKAVGAFQDAALAAGKLSDATGLSTEEASRWVAVADDIGISSEAMEKSFGKLAQSIGKNNPLLEQYGITVQKGADGQDDMNATMLHAIDVIKGIQDPTKKAAVAQAALGKGWMEMSELIEQGSGTLTESMAEVSEAQVIDPEEVEKARKIRESMDNLQDSVRDLALVVGEDLVPMVATLADGLTTLIGPLSDVNQWSKDVSLGFLELVGVIDKMPSSTADAATGIGQMASQLDEAGGAGRMHIEMQEGLKQATEDTAEATEAAADVSEMFVEAMENLGAVLDEQAEGYADSALAALGWMGDVEESMDTAGGAISEFSDEAMADIDTFQQELSTTVENLNNWQNDIVSIAAQTSPEFAGYLADMGLAGADLVSDLEGNETELATTFEQWKLAAEVAGRDVPGEIAKADPETQKVLETLGRNVISTLGAQVAPTKTQAKAVGTAIVDGMRSGIDAGARQVATAASATVTNALAAAQNAGQIHSPSRLFADEIGTPIAEGIAEGILEGADDIGDALEKAIKSAEKDALDAVDDLVDAAQDRFKGIFGGISGERGTERLVERVSDAETTVAEAQVKVNEAAAEFGVGSAQHLDALESLDDATRSLRDANYDLLQASTDLLDQGPAGMAAFGDLAAAAGVTEQEVRNLILAYRDLQTVQAEAAAEKAAIAEEATAAQSTRARFGQAAAAGLVPQDWIDHLSQFTGDPAFTVELMNAFLASLPQFHSGGIVPGVAGRDVPIMARAGEYVSAGGPGVVVNLGVQTLDGSIAPAALAKLVESINGGIRTGSVRLVS